MRILLITDGIPPVTLGGTGRIVRELGEGMARRGHDVSIVSAAPAGALPAAEHGVTFLRIDPRSARTAHYRAVFSAARAAEITEHITSFKPDVIHAHCIAWQAGYAWIHLAAAQRIPVIITCHDVSNIATGKITGKESPLWLSELKRARWTWNPLRNPMILQAFARTTQILCVSDALRELLALHGLRRMKTVHNGVDSAFWADAPSKADARSQLALPADATIFLLPGRIGHDKGSHWTRDQLPDGAHLVVAGFTDPAFFTELDDRFHYFPNQNPEQMRVQYAACDTALVPSLCFDCFPTVCLEAAASSRPCIGSAWGGARESIVDGETGFIVRPEEPDTLGEKMRWLMEHPDDAAAMGAKARKHAEKDLSLNIFLDAMEGVYREAKQSS